MIHFFFRGNLLLFIVACVCLFINSQSEVNAQIISGVPFELTVDQLKTWTPGGVTADAQNIASVSLYPRFEQTTTQLNPALSNDMKVVYAPDGMNGLGNYLEEQARFNLYNFTHWGYIDKLIWFGGTAEKTVQIPSAPWVNTAHRNGVKVFGNIFFAPNVFGGSSETVSNFLEKDADGNFIAVQKMKEISTYYKFDGWFINMETNTTGENALLMREFVEALKNSLPGNQEVIWYDSMLLDGSVRWQNYLSDNNKVFLQDGDTRVSDGMFINFFWGSNPLGPILSKNTATTIGRSEFDVFSGVDLWPTRNQAAFESGGNSWMEAMHEEDSTNLPRTSVALFASNAVFQNDVYSNFRKIDNDIERERFYRAEEHLFGGADLNPAKVDEEGFKGLSNWIPAGSILTTLPFKTSFNTGHGRFFATNGEQIKRNWHDINKQDILPTWQFAIEGTSDLKVNYDFTKAYNGGTSLKVEGTLQDTGKTLLKLYKTKLVVSRLTKVDITYALGAVDETRMDLVVAFAENPDEFVTLPLGRSKSSGWNIKTLKLSKYAGREIAMLGFQFSSDTVVDDYNVYVGELKVFNGFKGGEFNAPIANFDVDSTRVKLGKPVQFSSEASTNVHYRVWYFEGGKPRISREENPVVTYNRIGTYKVKLVTFSPFGVDYEIKTDYITVDNDPIADFTASATHIQAGSSVSFTNTSVNDVSWSWSFPGGTPSRSTVENPAVTYTKVGAYDVTLTATNADGSNTVTQTKFIAVTDSTSIDHTDPAGTGMITARAEINEAESKEKAFDNLFAATNSTKWLDNGGTPSINDPSWIQIQLPAAKIVNTLVLVSPNDAPDRDPRDFRLLGSNDGQTYTVLEVWSGQVFTNGFEGKILPFTNETSYTYYRLEITKNKEDVSLTQIAEIELRGPADTPESALVAQEEVFKIYPSPASTELTLEGEFSKDAVVEIVRMTDRKVVRKSHIQAKKTTLALHGIRPGVYIIVIKERTGTQTTQRVIIR